MKKILLVSFMVAFASLVWAGGSAEPGAAINAADAKALLQSDSTVVLLDVRTPQEFEQAHIKGAILLPYDQITATSAAAVIAKPGTTVIVYCRSGHRAGIAAKTLHELGYQDIRNLGGIGNWTFGTVKGKQ